MNNVLIDSDVIIWFLRGKKQAIDLLYKAREQGVPFCCAVSIVEVLAGARANEKEATEDFLNSLQVAPINREIANIAGWLINEQKSKGIAIDFNDGIIAATCLASNFILLSYNKKHYRGIKGLEVYSE